MPKKIVYNINKITKKAEISFLFNLGFANSIVKNRKVIL